jgi:hypothetical protein
MKSHFTQKPARGTPAHFGETTGLIIYTILYFYTNVQYTSTVYLGNPAFDGAAPAKIRGSCFRLLPLAMAGSRRARWRARAPAAMVPLWQPKYCVIGPPGTPLAR